MNNPPYSYEREVSTRYRLYSTGRRRVEKIVVFTPLVLKDIFNLGFGVVLRDGSIDDTANTNNGDIIKVLSTVIHIIKDFIDNNTGAKIVFKGSTKDRTMLYQRILKTYLPAFRSEFIITALEGPATSPKEVIFDPGFNETYLTFFVKRKS